VSVIVLGLMFVALTGLGFVADGDRMLDTVLPAVLAAAAAAGVLGTLAFLLLGRQRQARRTSWLEVVERHGNSELRLVTETERRRTPRPEGSAPRLLSVCCSIVATGVGFGVLYFMQTLDTPGVNTPALTAAFTSQFGAEDWALLNIAVGALFAARIGRSVGTMLAAASPEIICNRVVRPLSVRGADIVASGLQRLRDAALTAGVPAVTDGLLHRLTLRVTELVQVKGEPVDLGSLTTELRQIDEFEAELNALGNAVRESRAAARGAAALELPRTLQRRPEYHAALNETRAAAARLGRRLDDSAWMVPIVREAGSARILRQLRSWMLEIEEASGPLRAALGCYALLGVPPDARAEEIQQAYRQRIRECHPDLGGDGAEDRERRERMAQALNVARDQALALLGPPDGT
jgi:hypothetical protein